MKSKYFSVNIYQKDKWPNNTRKNINQKFLMYILFWSVVGLVSTKNSLSLSPRLSTKYKRRLTTCSRIDINDFAGKETLANFVDRDEKEKKDNVSVVFDGKQKAAIV